MSDDLDDVYWQDATPVEETMISNILAQRNRIEELEKQNASLEAKLVGVEGRLFNCAMDLNIYMDLAEKLQEELDNRERSNEL